eukprot:jgi/Chlat1/3102/Chrsp21S03341
MAPAAARSRMPIRRGSGNSGGSKLPLAAAGVVAVAVAVWSLFFRRAKRKAPGADGDYGAFIERLTVEPPPPPNPPMAPSPLTGLTFAIKDIFDVEGRVTGFGNPDWRQTHEPASTTAPAVETLRAAGARGIGITHMDEMAFSINGENMHYGTPVNPKAPGCVPGGSSSGSAVAVSAGLCDFALGTDTAGSVRIPASYTGIYGFRPSHNAVPLENVIPLAASFDAMGLFARDMAVLRKVAGVLLRLPPGGRKPQKVLIAEDLWGLVDDDVKAARNALLAAATKELSARAVVAINLEQLLAKIPTLKPYQESGKSSLEALRDAMGKLQRFEAWAAHGAWLEETRPSLEESIRARFEVGKTITVEEAAAVKILMQDVRAFFADLLKGDTVLCLPTTPGTAPKLKLPSKKLEAYRAKTMVLISVAGMGGLPQVSFPAGSSRAGAPLAVSLMARHGADALLLDAVSVLAPATATATTARKVEAMIVGEASTSKSSADEAKDAGNAAFSGGRYEEAIEHYTVAISRDAKNAVYYGNRAMAYIKLHRYAQAEEDCSKAMKIDPRNVKVLLRRGTARSMLGLVDQAAKDFQGVLALEPNNRQAQTELQRMRVYANGA